MSRLCIASSLISHFLYCFSFVFLSYSFPLAVYSRQFITSVVLGNDLVPRYTHLWSSDYSLLYACSMANYRTCNNTHSVLMNYVNLSRNFLKWQLTIISNKAYNLYNIYWCKHMKVSCSSVEPIFLSFMLLGSAAGHFII